MNYGCVMFLPKLRIRVLRIEQMVYEGDGVVLIRLNQKKEGGFNLVGTSCPEVIILLS